MNSHERLGTFAEMMNLLNSADHPELDEFLAQYPDDAKLQELAPVARKLWQIFHSKQGESTNISVPVGLLLFICLWVIAFLWLMVT
jgi:hypothetical protein